VNRTSPDGRMRPTVPNAARLQSDVAAEQASCQNDLKDFKFYPALSFGIGYAFEAAAGLCGD